MLRQFLNGVKRSSPSRSFSQKAPKPMNTRKQDAGIATLTTAAQEVKNIHTSFIQSLMRKNSIVFARAPEVKPVARQYYSHEEFEAYEKELKAKADTPLIRLIREYVTLDAEIKSKLGSSKSTDPMEQKLEQKKEEILALLGTLTPSEVDALGEDGMTAAHWATEHPELLYAIVSKGDINAFSQAPHFTAAYIVATKTTQPHYQTMVDLCLKYKARLDIANSIGYTPAHVAAHKNNYKMYVLINRLMMEQGYTPSVCSNKRQPCDVASYEWPIHMRVLLLSQDAFAKMTPEQIVNTDLDGLLHIAKQHQFRQLNDALSATNVNQAVSIAKRLKSVSVCPATDPARLVNGTCPTSIVKSNNCLAENIGVLSAVSQLPVSESPFNRYKKN